MVRASARETPSIRDRREDKGQNVGYKGGSQGLGGQFVWKLFLWVGRAQAASVANASINTCSPLQCERRVEYINRIQELDMATQAGLVAHIMEVGVWLALWGSAGDPQSYCSQEAGCLHEGKV